MALIYNSDTHPAKKEFRLASGYISTTRIRFEKEGILAVIQAEGSVEFFDAGDNLLASAAVSGQEGGRRLYEDVCCSVVGGAIVLDFPIYEWIDNYPHCDGEHDRWDRRTIGYHTLRFDLDTRIAGADQG